MAVLVIRPRTRITSNNPVAAASLEACPQVPVRHAVIAASSRSAAARWMGTCEVNPRRCRR